MGRFWLGAGILIILLALGLWVMGIMQAKQSPISQKLEQAAEAALSGEELQAESLSRQALSLWKSGWHGAASVSDHSPMDEIDSLFAQLEVYRQSNAPMLFAACCQQIASLVDALAEAHSLSWWNLL